MLVRWQWWTATLVAIVVALGAGYSMVLARENRAIKAELSSRNQFVQQTAALEGLYREMVNALADLSVRNQDRMLTELLANNGITLNTLASATQPNASAPTDSRKAGKP